MRQLAFELPGMKVDVVIGLKGRGEDSIDCAARSVADADLVFLASRADYAVRFRDCPDDLFRCILRVGEKFGWGRIVPITAGGIGVLLVMAGALNGDFPPGIPQGLVELPWLLR